jgi:PTS system ascorbate-specific IIA component
MMMQPEAAVLLVTHPGVGAALCSTAEYIMGQSLFSLSCIEVPGTQPADRTIRDWIAGLPSHGLILTDLYGATPHNIACRAVAATDPVRVLSGLNLPMLLRILNYTQATDLATLYDIARAGARRGIQ